MLPEWLITQYLSNIEILMFNIKVYDKSWNFIKTLNEKEISCEYSFWASVNWGYTSLKFEYYGSFELDHKQRIKIYKENQSIYQWFITGVTKKADKSGKKQVISCSWMIGLLSFIPHSSWTVTNNPSVLLRDIFTSSWYWYDVSWIQNYPETISISSNSNNQLLFLQDILKETNDFWLFIDAENKVWFTPYEVSHTLTYNVDCFNVELAEDSSNYYNRITLSYSWWSSTLEDSTAISKYGINALNVEESDIKDGNTARLRLQTLLKEYGIQRNYKISVNWDYNYYNIKPWQLLSLRNTDRIIENKPIKQVQYSKNTAVISLESYKPIENFIINQK